MFSPQKVDDNKGLEIFELLSKENQEKKLKRAKKRAKERKETNFDENEFVSDFGNCFRQVASLKLGQKPFHFLIHKNPVLGKMVFLFFPNNSVETRLVKVKRQEQKSKIEQVLLEAAEKNDHFGHGQAIRSISVSNDDSMVLSTSGGGAKLWNTFEGFQCTRSFETGYITTSLFLPGDRYALLGSKEGALSLYDLAANERVQEIEKAHEAAIWSLDCNSNPAGFKKVTIISGSADHSIKFWGLRIISEGKKQRLEVYEVKKQFVSEDVMCVKFTLDGKFYAYSMLDNSIRVHYSDTSKLFLTMYGHKLPVVAFDVTSDGVLLISGSADKNIRIWGMDFGDCHRTLFKHQDTVTSVKCLRDTHYFFTGSKDGTVKYFDGDTFELLLSFSCHFSPVWAVAVSSIGDFVVSGGNDKLLRVHKQTKDQFWAAEEEQKREEQTFVDDYAKEMLRKGENGEEQSLIPKGTTKAAEEEENSKLFKRKFENLKYGEQLIEALEETEKLRGNFVIYETELKEWRKSKRLQRRNTNEPEKLNKEEGGPVSPLLPPWFDARNLPEYIMNVLKTIKPSELESSLGFLHFSHIEILLFYVKYFIENNIGMELASRVLFYVLQNYEHQIKGSARLTLLLRKIQKHLRKNLHKSFDTISYNLIAMKIIKKELQESLETF